MNRLKVLMVGISFAETVGIEELLQQTGYLDQSHFVGLNPLPENLPDWSVFDLVCLQYERDNSVEILSFLADPLRKGSPPVFFIVDDYDPHTVLHLTNLGGRRVFPLAGLAAMLPASLKAVFGPGEWPAAEPLPGGQPELATDWQRLISINLEKEKAERLNDELERLVLARTGALDATNRELAAEISRRKAIEEISDQLEQILWQTPDIVVICNPNGSLRYLNKAGREMFRISDRQPIGDVDIFQVYSPFYQRKLREEILPYVLINNIWRGEMQVQLPDGKLIPVSQVVLVNRHINHEVEYIALISRDISEFKHIEQDLRDSREEYRTLAEAAHDYIYMVDTDGILVYANHFACQALNLDSERVVGMSAARFFPESYSAELLQMIGEVREIDSAIYNEGSFRLADREFWLGTWLVPVHNSIGKLVSILGISRDISEQRKTDDALKRALANEKQINQMQSSFFSMTSHQFRTPLSTILLSVEMLKKYGQHWDDAKRLELLDRIGEASRRLQAMLENILMISRVDSGNYETQHKEFDLVAFSTGIIQELISNDRDNHPVEFLHSSDRLMVCSDSVLLGGILDNLISNAFKYSPKGSPVRIKLSCEETQVTLEVSDEGIGIPEQDQKRLFQSFQRASNTETYPGTGIGLTIVKKSVELLNGHVFLKSKEGQGTTFLLRFPSGRQENGVLYETR